jgi:hypothetical protein
VLNTMHLMVMIQRNIIRKSERVLQTPHLRPIALVALYRFCTLCFSPIARFPAPTG